ncbi:MAG: glutamate-5-semialdehyde dehydrogenase [Sporomusaceae bacterium]|nr:glutamate-5-semialdehyde dehydrogenase [Sporomusaceae bacterium]
MDYLAELREKGEQAKQAARRLAILPTAVKNKALLQMADALEKRCDDILEANAVDIEQGRQKELSAALLDRLLLTETRITAMAEGLRQIAGLADPVGQTLSGSIRPNGLEIRQIRVPIGVIGMIYEARPNVTVDAAGLCLKSGNAVILRGGSEAIASNLLIARVIAAAAEQAGAGEHAIQLVETTDRQAVNAMLKLNEYLDVIIPRGGAGLIRTVVENATVPVIETGIGVCHTFIDASANLAMAQEIAFNAKVSRPAVCNAMETLLVHEAVAADFLPGMLARFAAAGVEIYGCTETERYHGAVKPATEADWAAEYHDLVLSVRVVDNLDTALNHIFRYGTKHSEAIVTASLDNASRFQREVDAACVYVNASTRFSDGFEFGFGAEIGISTQKLHARGPMGLNELTSTKYLINGGGQIR